MSAKLRIAHFTVGRCNPDSANGIDKAISCLSRAQARMGHTVSVFSLTDKHPLPITGVEVYCYGRGRDGAEASRHGLGIQRFSLPEPLVNHILGWRPDVVHLHSVHVPENIKLARIIRRSGIPYGVSIHGGLSALIRKRHRWTKLALKLIAERKHLRSAAFLHAISSQDAEGIRDYGLSREISVVPNGIELDAVPEVSNPRLLADLYPEVQNKRVFVFLGRLDPTVKGLDLLLHAFALRSIPAAQLVLIGPGRRSHLQELRLLSRHLGLASSVVFAGPAYGQLKFDLLEGADVFVHPSRTEGGLPFSVLEAAAMRKPCLVTPAADPFGVLARYRGGIVVAPDSSSIADGLERFSAMDSAELARMGANARSLVEQEFRWDPLAARMIDCYRKFAMVQHG